MMELPGMATLIFENDRGEILAYLRDDKPEIPFPAYWDLFGGHIEAGETPEEALVREIKEELNLELKEYKFFRKYECLEGDAYPNIKYVFSSKIHKPASSIKLYEGQRLRFFKPSEIKEVKFANILKQIMVDYLESKNERG